ncbi:hypothetical protein DKX38_004590 [Salix brachista]|uniref:beta-carotene 3-hydroxylase n=1 Tax=Salix brachista TaxID=2182728 RepID=A0A5N5NDU8_9ROSI|nr:hypothetical protein DKX38_004590 [Salix brachista]
MAGAAAISTPSNSLARHSGQSSLLASKPNSLTNRSHFKTKGFDWKNKSRTLNISSFKEKKAEDFAEVRNDKKEPTPDDVKRVSRVEQKKQRKKSQRYTYLVAAILSSVGITSMAAVAVYCRFSLQMEDGEFPLLEMFGTFALSVGAAVGMEFWARWAHRALWHASLWHMHESHHRPREGPFELNDVFAIINAVPAIALFSYGWFNKGLVPGLCFGAGLGITVFGIAYMFVHDGLVHRRFPVGPIANVPYLRKAAAAHQLHHEGKFDGVPYGLFLGPNELEEVGGLDELSKEVQRRIKKI